MDAEGSLYGAPYYPAGCVGFGIERCSFLIEIGKHAPFPKECPPLPRQLFRGSCTNEISNWKSDTSSTQPEQMLLRWRDAVEVAGKLPCCGLAEGTYAIHGLRDYCRRLPWYGIRLPRIELTLWVFPYQVTRSAFVSL